MWVEHLSVPPLQRECPAGDEPRASLLPRRPQQEARLAVPICILHLYLRAGPWLQNSPTVLQSNMLALQAKGWNTPPPQLPALGAASPQELDHKLL